METLALTQIGRKKSGEEIKENDTYNKTSDSKTISHGGVSLKYYNPECSTLNSFVYCRIKH